MWHLTVASHPGSADCPLTLAGQGEAGLPAGHVTAWVLAPCLAWSPLGATRWGLSTLLMGMWHGTAPRDTGGQQCPGGSGHPQACPHPTAPPAVPMGPAVLPVPCGYWCREERGGGGGMPSDALPICCVTSPCTAASTRRKGPFPVPLFQQRIRQMAPRLPPRSHPDVQHSGQQEATTAATAQGFVCGLRRGARVACGLLGRPPCCRASPASPPPHGRVCPPAQPGFPEHAGDSGVGQSGGCGAAR